MLNSGDETVNLVPIDQRSENESSGSFVFQPLVKGNEDSGNEIEKPLGLTFTTHARTTPCMLKYVSCNNRFTRCLKLI